MVKYFRGFILILGILLVSGHLLFAQVTIIPPNLFIPENSHFTSLEIKNSSPQPQEVSIRFRFGYPVTDSLGNIHMDYSDSAMAAKYSMVPWLHAFPRSFTLHPNESQIVRILVRSPQNLKTGMYWTRVQTISTPQTPPIGQKSSNGVSAQISFRFNQVTSAFLKVGDPGTGIDIESFHYKIIDSYLVAYIKAKRTGGAPFLGTIALALYKSGDNKPIKESFVLTSIYFDQTSRIQMSIGSLPKGDYSAKVTFKAQRNDIPTQELPRMKPISKKFNVTIN